MMEGGKGFDTYEISFLSKSELRNAVEGNNEISILLSRIDTIKKEKIGPESQCMINVNFKRREVT